jgi:5-methylcytosine-specific restriction endonuclease McrA
VPYKDPERRRQYGRDWIKRNAEKAREAMRRWRSVHPEEHNADTRLDYSRHREARLARSSEYHRAHPEISRARFQNYRARKLAAEGSFTPTEWLALVELHGGRCAYRGEEGPLEVDHRIPLSRGGSNRIDNILPACRSCNAKKHNMTEEEFRARLAAEECDDLQSD